MRLTLKIPFVLFKFWFRLQASCKNLIKYNLYNLKENKELYKEAINIEFTERVKRLILKMMNDIDLRLSDGQGED